MSEPAAETVTIDPARAALVIVDMQNDFCAADGFYARAGKDVSGLAAAVEPNARLLAWARENGILVVFTRLLHDPARGAMESRHRIRPRRWTANGERLRPGSRGAEVIDALKPRADELVIDKHGYSAFDGTGLEGELRARGIDTVLLSGVVTYACVLATGFSAFDRDFDVLMLTDAVGTWNAGLDSGTHAIVDLLLGHALPSGNIRLTRRDGRAGTATSPEQERA